MSEANGISVFGVRHHGPGSASSLVCALTELQPDCVLIEGPPDADELVRLAAHQDMQPPVALLVYVPDAPMQSCFYPFAEFSPEWQAIQFALAREIPVRFMDLPQTHQLALLAEPAADEDIAGQCAEGNEPDQCQRVDRDPLDWLGRAAGYGDGEEWWDHMVEHRQDGREMFAAIQEAMTTIRQQAAERHPRDAVREQRREAFMRKTIRAAQKEGHSRIAVVCGAWHVPALQHPPKIKEDNELLRGLPKIKVAATWVGWSYGRLTTASGYGAGVTSPGWYDHLWRHRDAAGPRVSGKGERIAVEWLTRIGRLLRDEDIDVSSAHVIEAVRLAHSLAALRQRPFPGLRELDDAAQTVMVFGESAPLQLVHQRLTVSDRLGKVPAETPIVPLQRDLEAAQKTLRLKPEACEKTIDLDLRTPTGLGRSHLLYRLQLIGVPWGELLRSGSAKGTFHEYWQLQWKPEFAVDLIAAARWGNTVADAAANRLCSVADSTESLVELAQLIERAMHAELPDAVARAMQSLSDRAAQAGDVAQMMAALPPLAEVRRYGDVRQTDTTMVDDVVDGFVARICVGLTAACASLDDDAARSMFGKIVEVDRSLRLLQHDDWLTAWRQTLLSLADRNGINGIVAGRACRILLESGDLESDEAARRLQLALSPGNGPLAAAAWIEGFLQGSGMILLHDEMLWRAVDSWVSGINGSVFEQVLPLVRRTFSTFSEPERRELGGRAKQPGGARPAAAVRTDLDHERAEQVLPLVCQLLGLGGGD